MDNVNSPEQQVSKETAVNHTWKEIRDSWQNSPFSEHCDAIMRKVKMWESAPRTPVNEAEWNERIEEQMAKAKGLLDTQRPSGSIFMTNKIVANGSEFPEIGQDTLTRVYVGLDPRTATDAYIALLDELEANDVLKDIQVALNYEELFNKILRGNTIIIYDPLSRDIVLNSILQAYRIARQKHPDLFNLTDRQKATVMKENMRQFKATIDANMSFVEMPKEEGGQSYDTKDAVQIRKAFGISTQFSPTDEEWIGKVKQREKNGVVYSYADREKIDKGQVKSGDTLHYRRKLSAPAFVNYGTVIAK